MAASNKHQLLKVVVFTVMGGFMFGYDLGLVGGVLPYVRVAFAVNTSRSTNNTSYLSLATANPAGSSSIDSSNVNVNGNGSWEMEGALGDETLELIVSGAKVGAVIGALLGGYLSHRRGRRWALGASGVAFFVGPVIMAVAPNVFFIVVGRIVAGMGIGISAVACPQYLGEVAPQKHRGAIVESYVCGRTMGAELRGRRDDDWF
jgi:MFS family permease